MKIFKKAALLIIAFSTIFIICSEWTSTENSKASRTGQTETHNSYQTQQQKNAHVYVGMSEAELFNQLFKPKTPPKIIGTADGTTKIYNYPLIGKFYVTNGVVSYYELK